MRTQPRTQGARSGPARSVAAFVTVILLVAGCANPTDTPVPTDGPSPTTAASLPTPSGGSPSATPASATPSTAPSEIGWAWEDAGMMAVARIHPHAILLGDGRVLVVGDEWYPEESGEARDLGTAELWDPASGTWSATESLNKPREDFAAVALADGRALVAGGMNTTNQSYSSAYVYDPRPGRESWTKVGLLEKARTAPAAAVLSDGRVLVAGGYYRTKPSYGFDATHEAVLAAYRPASVAERGGPGERLADVDPPNVGSAMATSETFDPSTGEWSATGSLKFARYGAAAVTLTDGRVLVVGTGSGSSDGVSVDVRAFDNAEIYDPSTGRFNLAGELPDIDRKALEEQGDPHANPVPDEDPQPAENGTLVALDDGGAVLIGHAGWWKHVGAVTRSFRFDPTSGKWSEIGHTWIFVGEPTRVALDTPGVRNLLRAAAISLPDGKVLTAGGAGAYQSAAPSAATAELYDPATNEWIPVEPMPEGRAEGTAVVLSDGSVLVAGESAGWDDDGDPITPQPAIRFAPGH